MTDRLRVSLFSYFSRHIESGDWCKCLKALHGCAETGTLLHSLPYSTLFPFLVEKGQWESVLRLSSQLMAVEDARSPLSCSGGSNGTTASSDDETLYNTLLRAAMAPEATVNMGSWQAATALVQRAVHRRVRLETPVMQQVLGAVEKWQREATTCGSRSSRNNNVSISLADGNRRCSDALFLARDILAADLHLRGESSSSRSLSVLCKPLELQPDLVRVVCAVLRSHVNEGETDTASAAALWSKFQEQMRASFMLSWEDAVHTVLCMCTVPSTSLREEESEDEDVKELQEVREHISMRPDVAQKVLRLAQDRMFDSHIISTSPTVLSGNVNDFSACPCCATSLHSLQRTVREHVAVELPKWEAVRALAMAELQHREKCHQRQQQDESERLNEARDAVVSLKRLCTAAQLFFLRGATVKEMSNLNELSDEELKSVEHVVRKILFHGAAVDLKEGADDVVNLVVTTIQSLMTVYVYCCHARDTRRATALGTAEVAYKGVRRLSGAVDDGKNNNSSSSDNGDASLKAPSALEFRREFFWRHVLFPDSLVAPHDSWRVQKKGIQEQEKSSRFLSAWQLLLRRVFRDPWVLTMWFRSGYCTREDGAIEGRVTATKGDMGKGRVRPRHRRSSSSVNHNHYFPPHRVDEAMGQLQRLVYFLGHCFIIGGDSVRTVLPLSELLTRQEDVDSFGFGLLQMCERSGASLADAVGIWRIFVASIATPHIAPLLVRMMDVGTIMVSRKKSLEPYLVAIVAVLHEIGVFSPVQKAQYTATLLQSTETCTNSWCLALALFNESGKAICEEESQHHEKVDSSLGHIMNALVVQATPPRWKEALQVAEILRDLTSLANVTITKSIGTTTTTANASIGSSSRDYIVKKTPLGEEERIDMYELVLPLRQRRHWISAMKLFDIYEKRRLSSHDVAYFAFAVAHGPVVFAQRVLCMLDSCEKSEAVAQAALVACSRSVSRVTRTQRKKGHGADTSDAELQARVFALHEASEVARLALTKWPTPINDASKFKFVWEKVKMVCAGDEKAARLLLRQSAFYDSEQARSEATALTHTVRLCHAAQDVASAMDAYRVFRGQFIGMSLPEETMLLLLELCVASIAEETHGVTSDDNATLCMLLQDALWMHESVAFSGKDQYAPKEGSFLLRACIVVFRLSSCFHSYTQTRKTVVVIPKFRCDMVPGMRPHVPSVLQVLVGHLTASAARLLGGLADFLGVLRALPPSFRSTSHGRPEQDISRDSSWTKPIEVLWCQTQQLQQQLGPVVPLECMFWLEVLRRVETCSLAMDMNEEGGGSHWVPGAFVLANDAQSRSDAEMRLNSTVTHALEAVFPKKDDALSSRFMSPHYPIVSSSIDAIVFVLQYCWHSRPPLTAVLAALSLAARYLREALVWTSDDVDVTDAAFSLGSSAFTSALVSFQSILSCFHLRHVVAVLNVTAHTSDSLFFAVHGALSRTAYEAVQHTQEYVSLLSAWVQLLVRAASQCAAVDENVTVERKLWKQLLDQMAQLIAMVTGICMAWGDSSLRDNCLRDLRGSCEALQRCAHVGYADYFSCGSHLLLHVMNAVFTGGMLRDDAVERLFGDTVVYTGNNNDNNENDDPSSAVMAVALLCVARQSSVSHMRMLQTSLQALRLKKDLWQLLHDNMTLTSGLFLLYLACYGDAAAVRRLFGTSIPLATQFISHIMELDALLLPVSLSAISVSSVVQPVRLGEHLAEIVVLATLSTCSQSESFYATTREKEVLALMEATGTVVPHRWDLSHAIALGLPLQKHQHVLQSKSQGISLDAKLRKRLAFALQSCGPWPRGTALQLLLKACGSAADVGKGDAGGNTVSEYARLMEAVVDLDARRQWRAMMSSLPICGSCGISPLLRYVVLQHHQTHMATSIVLGNALRFLETKGGASNSAVEERKRLLNTLCSSSTAMQLLAVSYLTLPWSRRGSGKEQKQLLLTEYAAWLSSSSSTQWWDALSAEVKHLILWTHVPFTLCKVATELGATAARSVEEQQLAAAAMLVAPSPAASASKSKTRVDDDFSFVLSYPQALFTIAWVKEMCNRQFKLPDGLMSVPSLCRALRVPYASQDGAVVDARKDESLLGTPAGFSSLQYVYGLMTATGDGAVAAAIQRELPLLLSLACSESMQEAAVLLQSRLAKRISLAPFTTEVLLAAWNVVLIRRIELGSKEMGARQGVRGDVQLNEASFTHDLSSAFLALALTALNDSVEVTGTTTKAARRSILNPEQHRQLIEEMLIHAVATDTVFGANATVETVDEKSFRRGCEPVLLGVLSLLDQEPAAASLLDENMKLAIDLLKRWEMKEVTWVSLWPPLSLELIHCRHSTKSLLQKQSASPIVCHLRHPVAVWWMLQQYNALTSRNGLPLKRPMMTLLNIFRIYVTVGVALFTTSQLVLEELTATASPPMFVRGAGTGLVVDQFISLVLQKRPVASRGRGNDSTEERYHDIIRHLVDAVLPRGSRKMSSSSSFLLGYAPLCSDGVQALARLAVLRDSLDRRRTATVDHVVRLLQIEKQRETARCVAARDAGQPLSRVHLCYPRRPYDIQVQLLFFLRAFAVALSFVNPLGWHAERQVTLDRAYTALLDFLQLYHESYGDVDITSRAVEEELDFIIGPGARRVIYAATGAARPECSEKITLLQLLCFFSGEWRWREPQQRNRVESDLHGQLHELIATHRGPSGVLDVLYVKDDNESVAPTPPSVFLQILAIVQEALWSTAATPSHALMLELLDAAAATDAHAARCTLKIFTTIAPYMVVSTLLLEKVLVLLLMLSSLNLKRGLVEGDRVLCDMTLGLVLRRFQYIPLNTPTAVALLCELYAAYSVTTGMRVDGVEGEAGDKNENSGGVLHAKSSQPTSSYTVQHQQKTQEWLLWRCAVEASGVACAPLEAALSHLEHVSLQRLQQGCLAFLLQGHTRPHYDPPFLRLGRLLDSLIIKDGKHEVIFTQQLLRMMEVKNMAPVKGTIPWRRALRFLSESRQDDGNSELLVPPDAGHLRFLVTLLTQRLSTAGETTDGVRQLWQQALSSILPAVCASSADENKFHKLFFYQAAAVALRVIHVVEPQQQWEPALQLTMFLAAEASSSPSSCDASAEPSSPGKWWFWTSHEAVLFHTLRYLVEACDLTVIPVKFLLSYMLFVAAHQKAAAPLEHHARQLNRARAVVAFTQQLQRHPYLRWTDALVVLESLNMIKKNMDDVFQVTGVTHSSCTSDLCTPGREEGETNGGTLLQKTSGIFFTTIMARLYKKQLYEPFLRFVEAAQQHHRQRVCGQQALVWLNHAASVVVAPSRSSSGGGGPWEVLMLLNGTLVGKTLDDILREQSAALLQERICLLQNLLRNGRCGDAAVLVRQSPALLHTREFYSACAGLMDRFRHNAIVLFYDELIHPGTEELRSNKTDAEGSGADGADHVEDVSYLWELPAAVLQQALEAFEVAANSIKGIDLRSMQTGLCITAVCLGNPTVLLQSQELLAATLRWIQRDVKKTDIDLLRIIADAVEKALQVENASNKNSENTFFMLREQQHGRVVTRLLVELLSDVFPAITGRLCELLLQPLTASTPKGDVWTDFLRSTAAYNAALQHAKKHCCTLLDNGTNNIGHDAIVQWCDHSLFSSNCCGGTAWLSTLAVYSTARSFVGYVAHSGAHIARLVKLITCSGETSVVIRAARDIFFHTTFLLKGRGGAVVPPFLEVLIHLGSAMWAIKRRAMHCLTPSYGMGLSEQQQREQIAATLSVLDEINQIVSDGLARLQEKQQQDCHHSDDAIRCTLNEEPLAGHMELACHLLGSITVTPVLATVCTTDAVTSETPLLRWRSIAQCVIGALPSLQRSDETVLNALMESVRDSFEVLCMVRQHPVLAVKSCQVVCSRLWSSALQLVTLNDNLRRHLFVTSSKQTVAMSHLETLLCCASLVTGDSSNDGAAIEAMKSLCDMAVRGYAVSLTEDAKAVVKIACIHHKGAEWRSLYEEVTGFAPTVAQRQMVLPSSEEALQQDLCITALDAVCDWAQALRIGQEKRDAGVRLQHVHYRRMLQLLEQYSAENESAAGSDISAAAVTVGDAVTALHFARMQDGSVPNVQAMEQSLTLLSHSALSPLYALQYAQAMTLLPPTNNRRHKGHDTGSSSSHASENTCFSLSAISVRLVTEAALRLPHSVHAKRLTIEEGLEGLRMFASFVRWIADFSRLPCLEKEVMETIVVLLCTMPEQLLQQQQYASDLHDVERYSRCTAGDVREVLSAAFVTCLEGRKPQAGATSTMMSLDTCRYLSGAPTDEGEGIGSAIPTPVSLLALRTSAAAALRILQRQVSLYRVLRLSNTHLCLLFASMAAGGNVREEFLRPLSRIAQDAELISPPVRYLLALTVTEQSVLWGFIHGKWGSRKKSHLLSAPFEVPTSVMVRSLAQTYNVVLHQFAPHDALMLRNLLIPKSPQGSVGPSEDDSDDCDNAPDGALGVSWGERLQERSGVFSADAWENSLKLFQVLLRNAQPHADLSLPFTAVVELLSRAGHWGLVCRYVTLVAKTSLDALNTKSDLLLDEGSASRLLSKHVVVDGFLLWQLVDAGEAVLHQQQQHRTSLNMSPDFWRLALHFLRQQQHQFMRVSLACGSQKGAPLSTDVAADDIVSSPALLALMKTICDKRTQ